MSCIVLVIKCARNFEISGTLLHQVKSRIRQYRMFDIEGKDKLQELSCSRAIVHLRNLEISGTFTTSGKVTKSTIGGCLTFQVSALILHPNITNK